MVSSERQWWLIAINWAFWGGSYDVGVGAEVEGTFDNYHIWRTEAAFKSDGPPLSWWRALAFSVAYIGLV